MSIPPDSQLPWQATETDTRLELVHDHRWLKVFGLPLAGLGGIASVLLWFIPGVKLTEAWPMFAVGSLIGIAFTLMGLHLSFNRVLFAVDRNQNQIIQQQGFGWFTRQKRIPLEAIQSVRIDRRSHSGSNFAQYTLELKTNNRSILIASFPDLGPIEEESRRWARYLSVPLQGFRDVTY